MRMREFITFARWDGKAAMLCIALVCAWVVSGCRSDNDAPIPQLTDVDWKDAQVSVLLNNECLDDASARFVAIPGSDSVRMELSGVHPKEKIEIRVMTSLDNEGNITFKGEQEIANLRHLEVEGVYTPVPPHDGASGNSPIVRIDIAYSVPHRISSKEFTIPFNDRDGFCYRRDFGVYPQASPEYKSRADSCEFICKRINSELGRHVESIVFRFDDNGRMTFEAAKPGHVVQKESFRYWISEEGHFGDNVVNIENGVLFYECLLKALSPVERHGAIDIPHLSGSQVAGIFVQETKVVNFNIDKAIILMDDLNYKIFPYLYDTLLTDGAWTDKETDCFGTIERASRQDSVTSGSSTWAFAVLQR